MARKGSRLISELVRKLIQIVILLLLAAVGSSMWILQQARQALEASMSIGQDPLRLNVSQGITLAEVGRRAEAKRRAGKSTQFGLVRSLE